MQANRVAAAAAARDLLGVLDLTQPPFNPFEIADRLKIPVRPIDTTDFSGCLLEHGGRIAIFYSTAINNEGFKRFTLAHEIGHHELAHHRDHLFDPSGRHASTSNFTSNAWIEQEADAFAVELLMPEDYFQAEMRKQGIGLAAIKSFAETFETSLTSTAIRYAELTGDPVIVIVSESGRVLYNFQSGCVKRYGVGYLPRGTPVPNASVTGRLHREGASLSREREGCSHLCAWFDRASQSTEFNEDVIELGAYGKTLTVLHTPQLPDRGEPDGDEDEDDGGFTPDGKRYRYS